MRSGDFIVAASCLLLAACATGPGRGAGDAAPPPVRQSVARHDIQVTRLAPTLWLHTTLRDVGRSQPFPSNGLIVIVDDGVVLIDTAWGQDETRRLLEWIAENIGLPVSAFIGTHGHSDRIGGLAQVSATGASLYLHEQTAAETGRADAALPPLAPGDRLAVAGVEVFYPGAAHTRDNLMVWIEPESLLFGGCAVYAASMSGAGNLRDADVAEWPRSLARTAAAYSEARHVLPSHGAVGDLELLESTAAIIRTHASTPAQ